MIKKSLLVFILLFAVYTLLLQLNKQQLHSVQYLYQRNVIKADRYINAVNPPKAAFLGTSLSDEIVEDSIPGLSNLAMAGLSLFDGSHIFLKRKKLPAVVFLEINYFFKQEDESFTGSYDSKVESFFKRNFKSLRSEYQPIGLLKHLLWKKSHAKAEVIQNTVVPTDVFAQLLKTQKATYLKPDYALINSSLAKLNTIVSEMQSRGSKVYFFEMPTDTSLEKLPLANIVRQSIKSNFPNIPFIPMPTQVFSTKDGIHLNDLDAVKYTLYFKSCVKNYIN